jgi:hypothetical protein
MLVVVLLTVMLAAAFALASSEYRVTDNAFASSRSLAFAEAGLQNFFSNPHNFSGTPAETTYTFRGGYARVLALKLRDSVTVAPKARSLWVVRSIGFDTARAPAGQPNGQRAIAQFAELQAGTLPRLATMVAPNGIQFTGSGSLPSGIDAIFCSPRTNTDSLAVPGPGLRYTSAPQLIDSTRIDWSALLAGQFTPSYVVSAPCTSPLQTAGAFRSGLCSGDATLSGPSRRFGLLVVKGNLKLESHVHWDGILVVGGSVDANRDDIIVHGMIVSGLNISQGSSVNPNFIRRGNSIGWASCYNNPSVGDLSGLVPIKNAWVDTWSTY